LSRLLFLLQEPLHCRLEVRHALARTRLRLLSKRHEVNRRERLALLRISVDVGEQRTCDTVAEVGPLLAPRVELVVGSPLDQLRPSEAGEESVDIVLAERQR